MSRRTPAYRAAFASWMARTSFWVMTIRGEPGPPPRGGRTRTCARRGRSRGERAASDPSTIPSVVTMPARNISAMTSTMPDPQMPVTPEPPDDALEARLVRPARRADDPEPRLERRPVDPDPLDRAGRGALAAADLGALEGRPGRARRGEEPALVAEDDLGVGADVDREAHGLRAMRLLGQDHPGRVGADVAGDAGQDVDPAARVEVQVELGGGRADGPVGGQGEGRRAERDRVDPEEQVVHDRVADDGQFEDVGHRDPGRRGQAGDEAVERLAHGAGHLAGALVVHHRVRDPAHQVLAEADLRVHHPVRRQHRAVGQVGQVPGDRGRADVDRDAVRLLVQPGPDRDDRGPLVDGHRHPAAILLQRGVEDPDHRDVRLETLELPVAGELDLEPVQVAGRGGQLGRRDLDVVEADDRIDLERAHVEALADDLAVDLALGRDVDDRVAEKPGRTAQPAVIGEAARRAVLLLDRAPGRQVLRQRRDAVLREGAQALDDLAPAAQPAPTAGGIDVDAERAPGVQDGRAGREAAAPARRREDDERLLGRGHRPVRRPGTQPRCRDRGRPDRG